MNSRRDSHEHIPIDDQSSVQPALSLNYRRTIRLVSKFISNQVKIRKKNGVTLGLSGGLDSSVAAVLAVKALGNSKVLAIILPEGKLTPKSDLASARGLVKNLNVKSYCIDIIRTKQELLKFLPKRKLASGNLSSRIRMSILYYFASVNNLLVLGTSDKSELMLGYFTKHGDGAADIFPLGGLYKTQVRYLAEKLGLPETLVKQPSSPGFWANQTAEGEIGVSYNEIDRILNAIEGNSLVDLHHFEGSIAKVLQWINKTEHKRELPPVCKIN